MAKEKYTDKLYKIMGGVYGDKFTLAQDDFEAKLDTNDEYRNKVYGIMQGVYGDKFTVKPDDFASRVKKKEQTQPQEEVTTSVSEIPATPSYESGERVEETIDFNAVKYGIKPPRKTEQQQDETQVKGAIASFKPPSPLELRRGETQEEYQIRKNQDLILQEKTKIDEQINSIAIGFDEAKKNIEKLNALTSELNAIKPPQGIPTPTQINSLTDEITKTSSALENENTRIEKKYSSLFSQLESLPKNENGEYIIEDEKKSKIIQSQLEDYNEEIKPLAEQQSKLNEMVAAQNKAVGMYNEWFSNNYPADKAAQAQQLLKEYEQFKTVEAQGKKRYEELAKESARLKAADFSLQAEKDAIQDEKIKQFRRDIIQSLPITTQAGIYLFGGLKMGSESIIGGLATSQSRQSNQLFAPQDQTQKIDFNAVKYGIKPTKEQDTELRKKVYEWGKNMYDKSKKTEADYGLVSSLNEVDNPLDMLSFVLTSIGEQAPQIPLSIATFGGSTYFQELGGMQQEIVQRLMDERGMSLEEALNSDEANKVATNLTALGIASLDMLGLVGQFGGKVLLGDVIKSGIKQSAVDRIALGVTGELVTETGQEFLAKGGTSQAMGDGFVEGLKTMTVDEVKDLWAKVLFSAGTFTSINTLIEGKVNADNIETLNAASTDSKVLSNLTNHIQSLNAAGVISTEEADRQIADLNARVSANLQIPDNIQGGKRAKLIELQTELDEVEASQKEASDVFKVLYEGDIANIKNKMAEVINEESQATPLQEDKESQDVTELQDGEKEIEKDVSTLSSIQEKYPDITLDVFESKKSGTISLGKIEVPKAQRGEGIATNVMSDLINYADANGLKITLTPSNEFGASKARLKEFYKRFGFVDNKGENRDFSHKDDMYRNPEVVVSESKKTADGKKEITEVKIGTHTSSNPIKIFKGLGGKLDLNGMRINAHKGVKGVFTTVDEGLAKEYAKDKGVSEIIIPEGTTFEVIEVDGAGMTPSQYRDAEVKAINNSKADVVKLITVDGKIKAGTKKQEQYIIKNSELINELKSKQTSKQEPSSGAKKPQEKQETAKTVTAEQKKKTKEDAKKDKSKIKKAKKDINKKRVRLIRKAKKGGFYNKSLSVIRMLDAIPRLSSVNDLDLLTKIQDELNSLLRRNVADINEDRMKSLMDDIDKLSPKEEKDSNEKAKSLISNIKAALKDKSPKPLEKYVTLFSNIEEAKNELDNALSSGLIDEDKYNDSLQEISKLEEDMVNADIESRDSYLSILMAKGNITRAKNRLNKKLEEGKITKEQHEALSNKLNEAKEKYENEVGDFIKNANKQIKEYFKTQKASSLAKEFSLSKPAQTLIERLFDVFKRSDIKIEDLMLADKLQKLTEAMDNGYFPMKDIYSVYKYIVSERNSSELVSVVEKSVKSGKKRSVEQIVRDFGVTVLAFKSGKFGKKVKDSQVIEKTVYAPLIRAIENSEMQTQEILTKYDKAISMSFWDKLNPLAKKRRLKNILLAGVFMNQRNSYLMKGQGETTNIILKGGDDSKIDVGSIDWLGVILGKEAALNSLEGNVNPTTRRSIEKGEMSREYDKPTLKVLNEIWDELPKKDDGSVDWDAVYNNDNFLNRESKKIIEASEEAFNDSYEYMKSAKMIRGEAIDEVVAYYKRARIGLNNVQIDYRTMNFSGNMRVVAGSSINRTTEAVGAIDFNVVNAVVVNAIEGTKFFNFEIGGGITNSTLSKAIFETENKSIIAAIKADAKLSLDHTYGTKAAKVDRFISKIVGAKYVESLFRVFRLGREAVSMLFRMHLQTGDARNSYKGLLKTKTLSKLESISGINITPVQSAQVEQGSFGTSRNIKSRDLRAIRKKGVGDLISMAMGSAEIMLRGGYTLPVFMRNFNSIKGENIDFNKLDDADYLEENKEAISEAMALTKIEMGAIYPTGNRFAERRRIKVLPFVKTASVDLDTGVGRILNYMSTFVFKESEALREAGSFVADELKESGVKAGTNQALYSNESRKALGVLAGSLAYSYLGSIEYLISKILSDDGEDKDEYYKLLESQHGLTWNKSRNPEGLADFAKNADYDLQQDIKGSLEIFFDQVFFFGIGRYGQSLRSTVIVGLSFAYDLIESKGTKEEIEEFMRNNFYARPITMDKYGLQSFATKSIPALDMGINTIYGVSNSFVDMYNITEKYVKGEKITEEDKAMISAFNLMFKSVNAALILKGMQIPEKKAIDKWIRKELSEKDKKQKGVKILQSKTDF